MDSFWHDERYARTDDSCPSCEAHRGAALGLTSGDRRAHVEGAHRPGDRRPDPVPERSSSAVRQGAAEDVAARHVDVYLL